MRGTRASGPSENAAPIKSPHQTSSAATLRTEGGEPPPFTASRTMRKAIRGPSVNPSRSGHLRRGPSTAAVSRISVTVLALVVLMILPPAATAATGADPSNPSLDQYVESVPSSHGGGPPAGRPSRGHLSDSVRQQIARRGGADAKQLEAVATSSAFGAPTSTAGRASSGASATGGGSGTPGPGGTPGGAGDGSGPPGAGGTRGGAGNGSGGAPAASGDHRPSGLDAITTAATSGDGSS